jgi:hypothetical protein
VRVVRCATWGLDATTGKVLLPEPDVQQGEYLRSCVFVNAKMSVFVNA